MAASASGEIVRVMALDSFLSSPQTPSLMLGNGDRFHHAFGLRTRKIDCQQAILQVGPQYLHAVGQHESPLELPRCDAAVEKLPGLVVLLPPANDELAFLDAHVELVPRKTGHRQGDPEPLGVAAFARQPLDVVGRIAVGSLGDAVERSLDLVETKQKRA